MDGELGHADFHRLSSLGEKFQDKRYRDGYVAAHTRSVLARQMRNFRGDRSQVEYGVLIDKRQTVVSRLESPAYGGWTLRTMLEIARKQGVALFCRFVDFPTFLKYTNDLSDDALNPKSYDQFPSDALEYEYINAPSGESRYIRGHDLPKQSDTNIRINGIAITSDPGVPLFIRGAANDETALVIRAS